jgi:uncharacterized protein involved in exopolysaccharide biosynthesis
MATGGTSVSLALIAIGAILRWAVTATVSGLSLPTVGLVLIVVGIVGFVVSLLEMFLWAPRRQTDRGAGYDTNRLS